MITDATFNILTFTGIVHLYFFNNLFICLFVSPLSTRVLNITIAAALSSKTQLLLVLESGENPPRPKPRAVAVAGGDLAVAATSAAVR